MSLSSRLKISFKSKSQRPHQDCEACRIKTCVYLIPICLDPVLLHPRPPTATLNLFIAQRSKVSRIHSPAPSLIQPNPFPHLLRDSCPSPVLTRWESQLTLRVFLLPLTAIRLLLIITHHTAEYARAGLPCLNLLHCLISYIEL